MKENPKRKIYVLSKRIIPQEIDELKNCSSEKDQYCSDTIIEMIAAKIKSNEKNV